MDNNVFKPMEISAIGEIMNISLGSSATAVSNLLDHRVDITTPTVTIVDVKDFELGDIEPAVGVEIKYVSGFVYHPPEILSETLDAALNLFYASQELRDAVPKLVDAYPRVLKIAPNLLEVHQLAAQTPPEAAVPTMSI